MAAEEIRPADGPVSGTPRLPGSKSYTNRALAVAALAEGKSTLRGAGFSDDTLLMAGGLRTLGFAVDADEAKRRMAVRGGALAPGPKELDLENAGTAMRFLTALVTLGEGHYRLDGTERMRERPIADLASALNDLGASVRCEGEAGCPPVVVDARGLAGGTCRLSGETSSQFLSGLLMVSPYARGDTTIEIAGDLVSKPYVEMTLSVMEAFGVGVERESWERFVVAAGQRYEGCRYIVEPDASAATYFEAAAAITEGTVTIENLGADSHQGDVHFADVLETMGCRVSRSPESITVEGPAELRGIEVDLNSMPDTVQTLAAISVLAKGRTVIKNVANLRLKETDRLKALAAELARLGAKVEEHPDGLVIDPPEQVSPAEIQTYDDHRMAMAFAVVGLCVGGIRIADAECVSKSFPDFFEVLDSLRSV
ncbi:MAG: 3-phosphoshikimate 1-carboxyvinyltransferase [Phycisphaerae bacterium]|jgi:3-phosphoshikimate 1-carboxyvinyltransferase|nr:3-phosphoshikimate 1-carboxyvinyltransferase [Phycisphaerae bacterium]